MSIISMFYHTINEIKGDVIIKEKNLAQLKEMTRILVIDDQEFTYFETFRNLGYNVTYKDELQSLNDIEAYDIILCDIRGVGKRFESRLEGAYLIQQIKKLYPHKIVIAYSADVYDAKFSEFLKCADNVTEKGMAIEDWTAILDDEIEKNVDPVTQWDKTRTRLFNSGVSTLDVAKYESQYVKAIKSGSFESLKKLYANNDSQIGKIMMELASSTLAKIIGG